MFESVLTRGRHRPMVSFSQCMSHFVGEKHTMNTMQKIQSVTLFIAMCALLAGCDRDEQSVDSAVDRPIVDQSARDQPSNDEAGADQQPMEHVVEFDGFTLRANVSRSDVLPEAMAQEYGIEAKSDHFLLNVVILEDRSGEYPAPVTANVSVKHESLAGHVESIDMRAVESNGHVSYIGILNASTQRSFQLVIEAQPSGSDQSLNMDFDVQLEGFASGDSSP